MCHRIAAAIIKPFESINCRARIVLALMLGGLVLEVVKSFIK